MSKIKRVSFDFDCTLDRPDVQKFAKELIEEGVEVWIVTSRYTEHYDAPLKIGEEVGIKPYHIIFTNMYQKADFFRGKDFIWHLDDDWIELSAVNRTSTKGISVFGNSAWPYKCRRLLK